MQTLANQNMFTNLAVVSILHFPNYLPVQLKFSSIYSNSHNFLFREIIISHLNLVVTLDTSRFLKPF
jgi:hypothetical protein